MNTTIVVECPICKKKVRWVSENRYRPFCSERCRLIDLGLWADEQYILSESTVTLPTNES